MLYELAGSINLESIWWRDPPLITVHIDQDLIWAGDLTHSRSIPLNHRLTKGAHSLSVCLLNKQDDDTDIQRNLDKAVVIESIDFFGISDPRFVWAGQYRPAYDPHWVAQQIQQGTHPPTVLESHTYLGWNGVWCLDFSMPIFTWIHRTQSLGWIYD